MLIYLDFDGTVVEHKYPSIGRENDGCFPIIQQLISAGHEVVLNTMRVEFSQELLNEAIDFINLNMKALNDNFNLPINKHTECKYMPTKWNWEIHFKNERIFIDDVCDGIPLKDGVESDRKVVDWAMLDEEFKKFNLY